MGSIIPSSLDANNNFTTPFFTAQSLRQIGISCLPLRLDGSKAPALISNHPFLYQAATEEDIHGWFAPRNGVAPRRGVGIVCGRCSGNLEAIDFDDKNVIRPFLVEVACINSLLLDRLAWIITPRPGLQLFYRCAEIGRNQILASREIPATAKQIANKSAYRNEKGIFVVKRAAIETRAEGGYCVAVGSPLDVHPSGRAYRFYPGKKTYSEISIISKEERELLFRVARGFCQLPRLAKQVKTWPRPLPGPLRAGDDYNRRGDVEALLLKHGWTKAGESRAGSYWRRPGKTEGKSAILNVDRSFYVFSSSIANLSPGAYAPFSLLIALEFSGNGALAAKYLSQHGYGETHAHNQ